MTRQRTRDYYEPPDTDIVYGLSALIVGLLMLVVRWAGSRK